MKTIDRTNEAMLNGRGMSALVSNARRIVDQTPVGDTFFLMQALQSFSELRAQEEALAHAGSR